VLQALTQVTSNINAITGDGGDVVLEKAAVQELSDALRGNLLLTGSEAYDKARRVLNKSIDKYPALIVQPSGVLSHVRGARIDPKTRTAFVEGGSHLGDLDHESMAHGLVTTAGTVSHTGVGGLTLGGGFGRLARRFGLALDNVKAVDIVTADGSLRHASAEENPELYWAVRGGGGNFGVVTSFEFNLHPMQRTVVGGNMVYPISQAREVMKVYADFCANAPDDLYADFVMWHPPEGGDAVALIHVCYSGDEKNADRVFAPLKRLGEPLANTVEPVDYVALQRSGDNADPRTGGDYMKAGFTSEINDDLIDGIVEYFEPNPDRLSWMFFQQSGGAIGRVEADATAFPHRYASHALAVVATWNPGAAHQPHFAYVRNYWKEIEPFTRGWYTNEVSDEAQTAVNANYQGNFDRLLKIKDEYDPTNLFRLNANIRRAV
jgi:FAD/FMN-containing dehydrogenase